MNNESSRVGDCRIGAGIERIFGCQAGMAGAYNDLMGKRGFRSLILASLVCGAVYGCRTGPTARMKSGKSGSESAKATTASATASDGLSNWRAYVAEAIPSQKSFLQFDIDRGRSTPQTYVRHLDVRGREEGSLIGQAEFPLDQYLDPHSRGGNRPKLAWSASPGKRLDAFFMEFRPAILEWPIEARDGEAAEALAQITAFERDGIPFAYGTCRRKIQVKGVESIRAGKQEFNDAVRMEADTELTFGWLATIRVVETAWFARDVGLVRREEHFNGRALWMFRFWGASRYELARDAASNMEKAAQRTRETSIYEKYGKVEKSVKSGSKEHERKTETTRLNELSRIAICLERAGRHIQVSGLAVEFGDDESGTR